MTTYLKVSSKWNMRESGVTFALQSGQRQTLTCYAVSLDSRMTLSLMQWLFRMWSPSIGWTMWRVKDGSHQSCHVTIPGLGLVSARVERHSGSNAFEKRATRSVWNGATVCIRVQALHSSFNKRATAYKYGESNDRSENSNFLLLPLKDPFGELFSEYTL